MVYIAQTTGRIPFWFANNQTKQEKLPAGAYFTVDMRWEPTAAHAHWGSLTALIEALRSTGVKRLEVEL